MAQTLLVKPKPNSGLFEITSTVGPIPDKLKGCYTSTREAKIAIETFRLFHFEPLKSSARKARKKKTTQAAIKLERVEAAKGTLDGESGEFKPNK